MPADKPLTKLIPRVYKWQAENLALFFFIKAQQQIFPALSIDQAIKNFRRFTGVEFQEWDLESMRSTYTRLQNEFFCNETAKENR